MEAAAPTAPDTTPAAAAGPRTFMLPPAKGIAAVRTEFIRQKEEKPTPPPQPPPPTADAPAADASDGPPPPKRMRGMNKQRDHYRPEAGVRLCAAILAGRDCTYLSLIHI